MPRQSRVCPVGIPQHIIQRGNNRQACFVSNKDMAFYSHWLQESSVKYGVQIHAWVFMTNHVHLLVTATQEYSVSRMMQHLGRHYVQYFNYSYRRSGTLWEGRFKSCLVQEETYFLLCQRYIELNPVRANIVRNPADYIWSSYRANALGIVARLRTPHPVYLALGSSEFERQNSYRSLFDSHVDQAILFNIRHALNKGLVFGTDIFREEIEQLTGQRMKLLKRGPNAKK